MIVPLIINTPDYTLAMKIDRIVNNISAAYVLQGSPEISWDGDKIILENQFPKWIVQAWQDDTTNAPVIDWFKYYYRWLFSLDYGYGCGFYFTEIRDFMKIPDIFLQAYADLYMPGLDFSENPELMDGFRKFLLKSKTDYFDKKGRDSAILYAATTLFGGTPEATSVVSVGGGIIEITTDMDESYNDMLRTWCCPVGFLVNITNT